MIDAMTTEEKARGMYLASTPTVFPVTDHPDDDSETFESFRRASDDIHSDLNLVLDTDYWLPIERAINAYVDWLLGIKSTDETMRMMRYLSQSTPHLYMDTVENVAWRVPLAQGRGLTGIYVVYDHRVSRHWYVRSTVNSTGLYRPILTPITIARLLVWSFDTLALRDVQYVNIYRTNGPHKLEASVWDRAENGDVIYPVFNQHPGNKESAYVSRRI